MKKLICMTAISLILATDAFAQQSKPDVYPSASDIPKPLMERITEYPESYIQRVLSVIRENGRDKNALDRQDIDSKKAARENDLRSRQVQQMVAYDSNFDGKVSRDEIVAKLSEREREISDEALSSRVNDIMAADSSGDGIVTMEEMASRATKETDHVNSRSGRSDPEAYLALDPNGDGKLTVVELESLARKAFRTLDTDGDGLLSKEEREPLTQIYRQERKLSRAERNVGEILAKCSMPIPAPDERIVFIGVYEGKTISAVSVAGQSQETDVIPLEIEKGPGKLYVIASSFIPVIWQAKGATDRISHLVLTGPKVWRARGTTSDPTAIVPAKSNIGSGVTGVAADKVSFRDNRQCGMRSAYDQNPLKQEIVKQGLGKILGRTPDLFAAEYSLLGVHVFDDHISNELSTLDTSGQKQAPAGFDQNAWMTHLRFMPGGVIDLKSEKIVSDDASEPYEVLPKWAGIAKLVYDGALVPLGEGEGPPSVIISRAGGQTTTITGVEHINVPSDTDVQVVKGGNGFKIVKDIPYYPARLTGGFSTQFVIARGVKPPKGDPGHSKVVCEETNRAPNSGICQ